ncbi:MAG: hypothetical protein IT423_16565, partial [Pirellulaceae bacterium]|nr:hypothetical protein [Pirellulaceae bacterium]
NFNGWTFDPDHSSSLTAALNEIVTVDAQTLDRMRVQARGSVTERTAVQSGQQFAQAVTAALAR